MTQWRTLQKNNFRNLESLLDFLLIPQEDRARYHSPQKFPLNLPRRLAEKIEKNNPNDPLFLQFVPQTQEVIEKQGFSLHPVEDQNFIKNCRLLQKYESRALLLTTGACAMHCRYCFRQNYDYRGDPSFKSELEAISADPSIQEVILSGGDPLSLGDETLIALLQALERIPHVQIIRFHTRFLIGIPERIEDQLLNALVQSRCQIVFVIHCNHPKELDDAVLLCLNRLKLAGVLLLNQSVLLKGVNDTVETLKELSLKLIAHGVLPYYLHQLDRVQGSAHFEVAEEKGLALIEELRASLPGYALPRYVREIPGKASKTQITIPRV